MDIYDIPIAEITRQYLHFLDLLRELNLDVVGEYLLMAAELTRIKSRCLLPARESDEDEVDETAGQDPRADLARRLLEYKRFKDAAFELRRREYDHQQLFTRTGEIDLGEEGDDDLVDASIFDLLTAFKKVLERQSFKKTYEVKISTLSVSDRISYILEILNASESVAFDSLFSVLNSKQEVIVTFLALLELMKMCLVRIQQSQHLGTIRVYPAADKKAQEEAVRQFHQAQTGEGGDPYFQETAN